MNSDHAQNRNVLLEWFLSRIPLLMTVLVLFFGLVRIFSYPVGVRTYDAYDFLEDITWARLTLESGGLLSPRFYYCYAVPFGGNLLMAPFVALLGPCLLANQLGMLVFYAAYIGAMVLLSRVLLTQRSSRRWFIALSSLFIYTYVGDNLLHHLLCYGIGYLCMLLEMLCCIGLFKGQKRKRYFALLTVISFLSACDGFATIGISNAVVGLALLICFVLEWRRQGKAGREYLKIFSAVFVPTAVGNLVYSLAVRQAVLSEHQEMTRLYRTSIKQMFFNVVQGLPVSLVKIFNNHPEIYAGTENSLQPVSRGVFLIAVVFLALFVCFSLAALKPDRFYSGEPNRFLYLCVIIVVAVSGGMHTWSTASQERFLFNGVLGLFLLIALRFCEVLVRGKAPKWVAVGLLLFTVLLSCRQLTFLPASMQERQWREEIVDILEENNVRYGYADYEVGIPIYVLSGGEISYCNFVRPDPASHRLTRTIEHSHADSFDRPQGETEFFLIVNHRVYDRITGEGGYDFTPRKIIDTKYRVILILDMDDWETIV